MDMWRSCNVGKVLNGSMMSRKDRANGNGPDGGWEGKEVLDCFFDQRQPRVSFSFHFQVTIHHHGMSGQELKQKLKKKP